MRIELPDVPWTPVQRTHDEPHTLTVPRSLASSLLALAEPTEPALAVRLSTPLPQAVYFNLTF